MIAIWKLDHVAEIKSFPVPRRMLLQGDRHCVVMTPELAIIDPAINNERKVFGFVHCFLQSRALSLENMVGIVHYGHHRPESECHNCSNDSPGWKRTREDCDTKNVHILKQ